MDTVKFQCGHCGNLMAVGTEFLGKQVRCPHCRQVVVAPLPSMPEPTPAANSFGPPPGPALVETTFLPPSPAADHEDIFSAPEEDPEDLFGRPNVPRLEVPPPEPAPSAVNGALAPPAPEPTAAPTQGYAPPPAASDLSGPTDATLPASPGSPFPSWMETPTVAEAPPPAPQPATGPVPSWMEAPMIAEAPPPAPAEPAAVAAAPPEAEAGSEMPAPAAAVRRASRDGGGGLFMPLVFMPIVLWAIFATGALLYAILITIPILQKQIDDRQEKNPFEQFPDDGIDRGVKKGGEKITKIQYDERFATAPLPAEQRMKLGDGPRRFGAIEVTPLRVERKRISVMVQGFEKSEPCRHDSLVLWLRFRNVSADQAFAPLDTYFDRWWKPGQGTMPLTQLVAGKDRFCGGPAKWFPPRKNEKPQWVEGRKLSDPDGLKPGEQRDDFVCTDGDDARAAAVLFGGRNGGRETPYAGPFLWRVQVRRGLVNWKGRERSATTVIGVEFDRSAFDKRQAG
jgi:hypothetical protein